MLSNYLKVALRNIFRHKGYSAINIIGLSLGITCCILILLWVQDELSVDQFHQKGDSIYRVLQDVHLDRDVTWAITQGPLGPSLKSDIPEIVNYTRCAIGRFRLKNGDQVFDEIVEMADPGLLQMFDFSLIKGDPKVALEDPQSIVISQDMAVKYFGDEDPMGKVLKGDDKYDFIISGILANIPRNSSLRPDFIIPFIFGRQLGFTVDNWGNSQFTTFIQLKDPHEAKKIENKIVHYLDDKPTLEEGTKLRLQPLKKIYLYSNFEFDRLGKGDIKYVHIFSITALFVLLIACINFMNLATARSSIRSKEVGIRKVVGAERTRLMRQFFSESLIFAFLALVIAILLVELLLPGFIHLSGKTENLNLFSNPSILLWILLITILTGFVSGSYPALLLSSLPPIHILKGKMKSLNTNPVSRKVLVVIQFSLSIFMIIATLVVNQQLEYIKNKKLGYNRDNLILVRMRGDFFNQYDVIKSELLKNPKIIGVTRSASIPSYGNVFSNSLWRWKGQNPNEEVLMHGNFVDYDFFKTFEMKIKEGRSFSKEFSTDKNAVILNEEAIKCMGVDSPVGMELMNGNVRNTIVGVVENYHFRSLHKKIEPLVLIFSPSRCRILCARISSSDISSTIAFFKKIWKQYSGDYPFNYWFLDERLDNLYRAEQRVGTIFKYFTLLIIFISCLGLFGLASYVTERRIKEIGIRKTLGASMHRIAFMLSKEFTLLILLANVFAWPFAFFVVKKWLQGFPYHTDIHFGIFILGGMLSLVIAWMTIAYQSLKTARVNPVEILRYE